MNTKNLLAIIVGTVVSMLLGMLIFGMLLKDTMDSGIMAGFYKQPEEFIWWAMIVANLCFIILITLLFSRMGINDFKGGFITALWITFLIALGYDLFFWAASNMFNNTQTMIIDVIASAVVNGIVGGVIGLMLGRGKPAAATA